jgi:hypothetical protein
VTEALVARTENFLQHPGRQIGFWDKKFVVGDLARKAQLDWDRPINASPSTETWQALFFSMVLDHFKEDPKETNSCRIVIGAPKDQVESFNFLLQKKFLGEVEVSTPDKNYLLNIDKISVVPESMSHALTFHDLVNGPCIVISLGFGTVEFGAASEKGAILERSIESINFGLHQICRKFRSHLKSVGFDSPKIRNDQYHFWDKLLQRIVDDEDFTLSYNGQVFRSKSFKIAANKILRSYAERLWRHSRSYFDSFDTKMPVILTGGGVCHKALVNDYKEYLEKELKYSVFIAPKDKALYSGAVGYHKIAQKIFPKDKNIKRIGGDIGNNTVATCLGLKHGRKK